MLFAVTFFFSFPPNAVDGGHTQLLATHRNHAYAPICAVCDDTNREELSPAALILK